MKIQPLVSVMMAAYNAEKFIAPAIESILHQTYSNWELIILNDGSTDDTKKVIETFSDNRIRYYENKINKGLVFTRNRMISLSNGKYLAVLDSDDISYSKRLSKEVQFLEKHPEYCLVGSSIEMIDASGNLTGEKWLLPARDKLIPSILFFHNNIAHSTVLMRHDCLPSPAYREGYAPAEDYDLWIRLSQLGKIHNFYKPLVAYRKHESNVSMGDSRKQLDKAERKILCENVHDLTNGNIATDRIEDLYKLVYRQPKEPMCREEVEIICETVELLWQYFPGKFRQLKNNIFAMLLFQYFLKLLKTQETSQFLKLKQLAHLRVGNCFCKASFLCKILSEKIFRIIR